jgi:uncharacterized repeat protein (TIGR03803 family)
MLRYRLSRAFGPVIWIFLMMALVSIPHAWAAGKYRTLYRFKGKKDGSLPYAGLIFDPTGNLYGTTSEGGAYGYGTVFKLTVSGGTWTESVLHSFNKDGQDGIYPYDSLIFDPAGNLYGTTFYGGTDGGGIVFRLSPMGDGAWTEKVIYNFSFAIGWFPQAALIFDSSGNLYGTTVAAGGGVAGTVFELTPNADGSWTESTLLSFNNTNGFGGYAAVIFDSKGNLYGNAAEGGAYSFGTTFELTPNSDGNWTDSVLHSFGKINDGRYVYSGLVFDPAGNLYGTTVEGGIDGGGTVFRLTPNSDGTWTENLLYGFCSTKDCQDGGLPRDVLVFDATGNLYGTTELGGAYADGLIFKLTSTEAGWKETVLHSFRNHPGSSPYAGLTFDGHGNLFGTTLGDAKTTFGSVFELSH